MSGGGAPGPGSPHVAVVGGGISGLAGAHRLRTLLGPDARITLVERSSRCGGVLDTVDVAGVPMDVGAEAFLARRPEVPALLRELGLDDRLVHPSPAAPSVRAAGRTVPLPGRTMLGVPGSDARLDELLSASAVARVAGERTLALNWAVGGDVALGALLRARFGDELTDRLVEPLLGGVYAGRVDRLGLRATIPGLASALDAGAPSLTAAADTLLPPPPPASRGFQHRESGVSAPRVGGFSTASRGFEHRESGDPAPRVGVSGASTSTSAPAPAPAGPVFGAVRGGYRVLVDALLAAADVEVRLGLPARALIRRPDGWLLEIGTATAPEALEVDAVLLAVPAPAVRKLLADAAPEASRAADAVELASPVVIALAYRADDAARLPETSGVLVAADEPLRVKAFTHTARKWPQLAPEATDGLVRLRASLGRAGDAAALQVPDEELVRYARADLAALTGIAAEPVTAYVRRWGGGLPQYGVGHGELVASVERAVAALPRVAVAGAMLHGVGVPACIGTGRAAVERLVEQLGRTTGRHAGTANSDSRV